MYEGHHLNYFTKLMEPLHNLSIKSRKGAEPLITEGDSSPTLSLPQHWVKCTQENFADMH